MRSSGPIGARESARMQARATSAYIHVLEQRDYLRRPPAPQEKKLRFSPPSKTLWHSVREFSTKTGTFPRKVYYIGPKSVRSSGPIGARESARMQGRVNLRWYMSTPIHSRQPSQHAGNRQPWAHHLLATYIYMSCNLLISTARGCSLFYKSLSSPT